MDTPVLVIFAILQLGYSYPTDYNSEMSFKTLESGESSGEVINQCCHRESKFVTVGYGISEGEVRKIDVGQCRQKCLVPKVKPLKREEFDKYLKDYPDVDPIQIFLSLQSKHPVHGDSPASSSSSNTNDQTHSSSCLQSTCLPALIKRETYYDVSGEGKEIDVIETCDCLTLSQKSCHRLHSLVRVHTGTPFEKEVDLGQCLGSCRDNSNLTDDSCSNCKAVRNKTISVDGPNGANCLSVIEECECVGECFRERQFLKVFDYAHVFETMNSLNGSDNNVIESDGRPSGHALNETEIEPRIKVIDIGRCGGSCSSDVPLASKCLLWSQPNNGTCLSYLAGGRSKCTANKFMSHSYTDKQGKKRTVVAVTGCGCQ